MIPSWIFAQQWPQWLLLHWGFLRACPFSVKSLLRRKLLTVVVHARYLELGYLLSPLSPAIRSTDCDDSIKFWIWVEKTTVVQRLVGHRSVTGGRCCEWVLSFWEFLAETMYAWNSWSAWERRSESWSCSWDHLSSAGMLEMQGGYWCDGVLTSRRLQRAGVHLAWRICVCLIMRAEWKKGIRSTSDLKIKVGFAEEVKETKEMSVKNRKATSPLRREA